MQLQMFVWLLVLAMWTVVVVIFLWSQHIEDSERGPVGGGIALLEREVERAREGGGGGGGKRGREDMTEE